MKKIALLSLGILLLGCQSKKEEARQPIPKAPIENVTTPITEKTIAHSVLYEANINSIQMRALLMHFLKISPY